MIPQELHGILSNWDSIEADIRIGLNDDFGKSKNLQDIIDIIHELQITAVTVSPIRELFNKHVTDINNPHEVQINIDDLELLQTLYGIYTDKYGADLTLTEFTQSFFQIRRLATREDVDTRTNLDSVVTPDVLEYLVELHNEDTNAHADLLRYKMPGVPLRSPPSFIVDPGLGVSGLIDVDRNCEMNYHDINGQIKVAPINQAAIDFSYGVPAIPIFSSRRNILLNSRTITGVSYVGGDRQVGGPLVITPSDDTNYLLFQENGDLSRHGWTDVFPELITGRNIYYVLAYPIDRHQLAISLFDNTNELKIEVKYDLINEAFETIGNLLVQPSLQALPNGWVRCSLAFDATDLNITKANVDVLDDNGIREYQGSHLTTMGFWQHQLTKGSLPVPPIFTDNLPVSILGTKITKNFTELYNPIRGTFSLKYISSLPELFGDYNQILKLTHDGTDPAPVIDGRTDILDSSMIEFVSYNEFGNVLSISKSINYEESDLQFVKRAAFTYTSGYQGYAFTDTIPNVFRLSNEESIQQIRIFFRDIYEEEVLGVKVIQLSSDIDETAYDIDGTMPTSSEALLPVNHIHSQANHLEIGYSSETDKYLEGYLINFRYYSVFANELNLEFLMDQYLPR